MPVVLRHNSFDVIIFYPPREHGPAHVHVRKAGAELVVSLSPVEILSVGRMRDVDVMAALRLVEANVEYLLGEWRKHHA